MTNETEPLTDEMILALRREAAAVGDQMQVGFCNQALDGLQEARGECAQAISNARAMDEDTPFVLVVP